MSLAPGTRFGVYEVGHAEAVLCADRSKVVELRFIRRPERGGNAEVLRVSPITVMREWQSAKAWLYRELAGPAANGQRALEPRR